MSLRRSGIQDNTFLSSCTYQTTFGKVPIRRVILALIADRWIVLRYQLSTLNLLYEEVFSISGSIAIAFD